MTTAVEMKIDQEFKSLIPPLSDEERDGLEASIASEGCRDSLVVWKEEGILLDGHNRYEICERLGVEFETVERSFESRNHAKAWVIENQFGRRNLQTFVRGELVVKLEDVVAAIAKEKKKLGKGSDGSGGRGNKKSVNLVQNSSQGLAEENKTRTKLAKLAGTSHDTIAKVKVISQHADEKTKQKLRAGEVSINAVHKQIDRELKEKAKAAECETLTKKVEKEFPLVTDRYRIIKASVADAHKHVDANSVDWIITDPPYPKEFLPVYGELAEFAAHALKPGGSLVCMIGQSYFPEIMSALCGKLNYHWTLAYMTPGGQAVQLWDRKVNTFWKPLLWFVKGEFAGEWIGDVCKSDVNDNDKRFHGWGQSESGMADILNRFTKPSQVICDPFMGGGTTGVVSVATNRRFIGLDTDEKAIGTSKERLSATRLQ